MGAWQYVAALQNDGTERLYHIHAVFNLVDPETKTARSVWRDHTKMREASRVIEFAGGWQNAERPSKERPLSRESLVVGARLLADPQPLLTQLTAYDATFTRVQAMAATAAKVEDLEQRQELLATRPGGNPYVGYRSLAAPLVRRWRIEEDSLGRPSLQPNLAEFMQTTTNFAPHGVSSPHIPYFVVSPAL